MHCWKISLDTLVGFPDVVDSLHKMQDIYDEELAKMEAEEHGFHESALHGVELAQAEPVIKCPSPLNVCTDTYDHSCF